MALTIAEASDRYANFMRNPAPAGAEVCPHCWTFKSPSFKECYSCDRVLGAYKHVDAVVPITYSIDREQMHTELRGYKDGATRDIRRRHLIGLTAVLWRFLAPHEACIAAAAGVAGFDLVTTVPSKTASRDESRGQLRHLVGNLCRHTADRYTRVLSPTDQAAGGHQFEPNRYRSSTSVDGKAVLLIDDTWTTGASAESAAYALKQAGATRVACVPIGRHVHRVVGDSDRNHELLEALPKPFNWQACALCGL